MIPSSRPNISREKANAYLAFAAQRYGTTIPEGVCVLGIRGYYLDSMGKPGVNDRGEYDDAIIVISKGHCAAYNANTDPSRYREGIAVLKPGIWVYKRGIHGLNKPAHKRYTAFVQDDDVIVVRDQVGEERGMFGINIHRGGEETTSSLGCQTIPPNQWQAFESLLNGELRQADQRGFAYILVEETEFRKGGAQ